MSYITTSNVSTEKLFEDQMNSIHFRISIIVMAPMACIIFLFNLPFVFYIIITPKMRIPPLMFVLFLGLTDLAIGVMCLTKAIVPVEPTYQLCLVRVGFVIGMISASTWYFFLIALDRLIIIIRPFDAASVMSLHRSLWCIIAVLFYSIIMGIAPLWGWSVSPAPSRCSTAYVAHHNYIIFTFVTVFILPLTATTIIYLKIFSVTRRHIRKIAIMESSIILPVQRYRYKVHVGMFIRTMKAIKMLAITIGCFLFTWGPFMIANLVEASGYNESILKDIIGTYLLLLGLSNAILNPIIYAMWNKDFRHLCYRIRIWLHYRCHQKETENSDDAQNRDIIVYTVNKQD